MKNTNNENNKKVSVRKYLKDLALVTGGALTGAMLMNGAVRKVVIKFLADCAKDAAKFDMPMSMMINKNGNKLMAALKTIIKF